MKIGAALVVTAWLPTAALATSLDTRIATIAISQHGSYHKAGKEIGLDQVHAIFAAAPELSQVWVCLPEIPTADARRALNVVEDLSTPRVSILLFSGAYECETALNGEDDAR